MTGLQYEEKPTDLPLKQYAPDKGDQMGLLRVPEAVEDFQPDVIYCTGEPGSLAGYSLVIPARIPFFAYVPIEGEPIVHRDWRAILSTVEFATVTEYGAKVVRDSIHKDVPWAYHGVDPEVFRPDDERRQYWRERFGWQNKFVVIDVAQNVRRKQWPRLFEAMALLKHQYHQKDIVLYAHCVPFQGHWLEGWDLPAIGDAMGIHDEVVFNPVLAQQGFGGSIPEHVTDADLPTLPDLYRAADLFVLPSQVEGFGLPIAEAMACGTPVMVTKYAAGWEVAAGALGYGIPVYDWEIAKHGTRYANVKPDDIAKGILSLRRDPKRLSRMREAGLERSKDFRWEGFEEVLFHGLQTARPVELPEEATA